MNISSSYASEIAALLSNVKAAIAEFCAALRKEQGLTDAEGDNQRKAIYKKLQTRLNEAVPDEKAALRVVTSNGVRIAESNKAQVNEQIKTGIGVTMSTRPEAWLEAKFAGWIKDNTDLIKSVAGDAKERASQIVFENVSEGIAPGALADKLERFEGMTESKAELIARDQTGKFFSELTQERFKDIGVERYIWQTADDAAVREIHAELNGKTFNMDEGDEDGCLPGENYQCRCVMLAVFEDLLF